MAPRSFHIVPLWGGLGSGSVWRRPKKWCLARGILSTMLRERIPRARHHNFGLWKLQMLLDRHFGRLLARSCARQNAPHRDQTSNWTQLIMIEEPKLFLMAWSFILLLIYKSCFEDVFERQLNRVSFLSVTSLKFVTFRSRRSPQRASYNCS